MSQWQRRSERHLEMRVVPLGESEWQPGTAQGPLPGAHEVEMRGEAHHGPLLELDPETGAGRDAARAGVVVSIVMALERRRRRLPARAPAEGGRGGRGDGRGLREIERTVRLLDPRPLRAVAHAARET